MNVVKLIDKKRSGKALNKQELTYLVDGFVAGEIPDYQMSAFLMAVTINGFSDREVIAFTDVLVKSGKQLSFDEKMVDKHSTGGVGDKTTLIIAPIVAALGMKMVKMSGRGLGHTGGTVDKLMAIQNMQLNLPEDKIKKSISEIGVCLLQQSAEIAPADKMLYQLRDVTATTESIPLIASSIMCKKIASGAKIIVIDIKVGKGAFLKTQKEGRALAQLLQKIAKRYHIKLTCVLSRMDEPLGINIGNGLEVMESLSFLNGDYDDKLYDLVVALSSHLLVDYQNISHLEAQEQVKEVISNKEALNAFFAIIENQEGRIKKVKISRKNMVVKSVKSGYIKKIDALQMGQLVQQLGAGRLKANDKIDLGVGVVLLKKSGDYVKEGETLLKVYYGKNKISNSEFLKCYHFANNKTQPPKSIIAII